MINLQELPTEKEEMAKLQPTFPRLENDSPDGCPSSMADIKRYVTAETGRKGHDLFFGRTALVGDIKFWLWGFMDDGKSCYVDVSEGRGKSRLAMGSGEDLTPEQYIALRYVRRGRG